MAVSNTVNDVQIQQLVNLINGSGVTNPEKSNDSIFNGYFNKNTKNMNPELPDFNSIMNMAGGNQNINQNTNELSKDVTEF